MTTVGYANGARRWKEVPVWQFTIQRGLVTSLRSLGHKEIIHGRGISISDRPSAFIPTARYRLRLTLTAPFERYSVAAQRSAGTNDSGDPFITGVRIRHPARISSLKEPLVQIEHATIRIPASATFNPVVGQEHY